MARTRFLQRRRSFIITAALFCLCLTGCQTVLLPNVGEEGYSLAEDEQRMINRADEFIEEFDRSDYLYRDEALERYLNRLAEKLIPQRAKKENIKISIKILRDPVLNAFTFANGRIYIHTGMLATCENEAMLATLMAHEIIHAVNRHAVKTKRSVRNKSAFISTISSFGLPGLVVSLGTMSSISGYSKHLEYEADEEGFQVVLKQGYDISQSPKLFEAIGEYLLAEKIKHPFFFSTHPKVKQRIKNFTKFYEAHKDKISADAVTDTREFQSFARAILLENILQSLQKGYFKTAEKFITRFIEKYPDDAAGHYQRGELFRQRQDSDNKKEARDKSQDYSEALKAYEKSIALNVNFAKAYKGKAQILQKQGESNQSKAIYRKYLELDSDAPDRAYIEKFINS